MSEAPPEDEYEGLFRIGDSEDDSDEEYFMIGPSGKILKAVDSPYNLKVKIEQANRELFSQPPSISRKPTTRVKFNLVPRLMEFSETGELKGEKPGEEPPPHQTRRRESYLRRVTPVTVPVPGHLLSRSNSLPENSQQGSTPQLTMTKVSWAVRKEPPKSQNSRQP